MSNQRPLHLPEPQMKHSWSSWLSEFLPHVTSRHGQEELCPPCLLGLWGVLAVLKQLRAPDAALDCRNLESYPRDPALHGCLLSSVGGDSVTGLGRPRQRHLWSVDPSNESRKCCQLGEPRLGGLQGFALYAFSISESKEERLSFCRLVQRMLIPVCSWSVPRGIYEKASFQIHTRTSSLASSYL